MTYLRSQLCCQLTLAPFRWSELLNPWHQCPRQHRKAPPRWRPRQWQYRPIRHRLRERAGRLYSPFQRSDFFPKDCFGHSRSPKVIYFGTNGCAIVFPLHQITHVRVNVSRYLKLFGREIIVKVCQPVPL